MTAIIHKSRKMKMKEQAEREAQCLHVYPGTRVLLCRYGLAHHVNDVFLQAFTSRVKLLPSEAPQLSRVSGEVC